MGSGEEISVSYKTNPDDFQYGDVYYLTISAFDGNDYNIISNEYTFKISDIDSEIYCGEYNNVPVIKNFGIMLELENNEFIRLEV
ncbi:MAG: hypothetical protein ACOCRK_09110, partial [bacterium]